MSGLDLQFNPTVMKMLTLYKQYDNIMREQNEKRKQNEKSTNRNTGLCGYHMDSSNRSQ